MLSFLFPVTGCWNIPTPPSVRVLLVFKWSRLHNLPCQGLCVPRKGNRDFIFYVNKLISREIKYLSHDHETAHTVRSQPVVNAIYKTLPFHAEEMEEIIFQLFIIIINTILYYYIWNTVISARRLTSDGLQQAYFKIKHFIQKSLLNKSKNKETWTLSLDFPMIINFFKILT